MILKFIRRFPRVGKRRSRAINRTERSGNRAAGVKLRRSPVPMAPERWQQVERIYHEAAARPLEERSSFLDRECAGDAGLRGEVERMLAVDLGSDEFLNRPAFHGLPSALVLAQPLSPGSRLGPYEIISILGTG